MKHWVTVTIMIDSNGPFPVLFFSTPSSSLPIVIIVVVVITKHQAPSRLKQASAY